MFEFVTLVVLANLAILGGLYVLRHFIAIRAPVLFMAVGLSILLCILYPFVVVLVSYPQVIYLYAALILAGAALLSVIESKFLVAEELRQNENLSTALGDVLVATGGAPAVEAGRDTFHVSGGANLNQTRESPGNSVVAGEPPPSPIQYTANIIEEVVVPSPWEPGISAAPGQMVYGSDEPDIAPGATVDDELPVMPPGSDYLTAVWPAEQAATVEAVPEEITCTVDAGPAEPAAAIDNCYPVEPAGTLPEEPVTAGDIAGDLPAGAPLGEGFSAGESDWVSPASLGGATPPELAGETTRPELVFPEETADEPPADDKPGVAVSQPEDYNPAPARGPYPGGMTEGPGEDTVPTGGEDIGGLVARSFDALVAGDKFKGLEGFFKVLKLNPEPRLAAMLCIEISSIYLSEGRRMQALSVMEMLQEVWGPALGEKDSERIKTIIIQIRREAK